MTKAAIAVPFRSSSHADDGGLGDRRVVHERRFDLHRPDPVAGDVHDVVHPPEQPEVPLPVAPGAVGRKVDVRAHFDQ